MILQAERGGALAVPRHTATSVALVISLPILSLQVQEILSRRPEIEVRLVAYQVAELAGFPGRDWLEVVICEPADANEVRSLLHPGQQLVVLGSSVEGSDAAGGTPADLAESTWSALFAGLARGPSALQLSARERRLGKFDMSRRGMVAWLLKQYGNEAPFEPDGKKYVEISPGEWLLSAIPHLGCATAVLFLNTQRIPEPKRDVDYLLRRLRSALRDDDAVFRLDDSTFVVLTGVPAPASIPGLLIRLSWRLWPADPSVVAASHAVWRPGQDIDRVIAAGRLAQFAAAGAPQFSATVTAKDTLLRAGPTAIEPEESLLPAWGAPHPDLRRRGSEIEPWCADLPCFAGETDLRLAVEAQEEEEFGHVGHGLGVARIAAGLAAAMDLPTEVLDSLRTAALLHDGGKLALDRALWEGRGTILPWQRKLMEAHASFGSALADQVGVPDTAVMAILHHHERWDGAGYPAKLQGDLIPLPARILFVAEVVDSMLRASYRRQPLAPSQVVGVLEAGAGHLWDPEVTRHAVRMVRGSR
jgi:HD-GYP domain-containing protein (c-di-GMP phosphodiesterase class II)